MLTEKKIDFYKRFIPFTISLALFMEAVDATIINTAIPAMSKSLSVDPIDLKIALISYLMSMAIFIPISGWVADKFGIKRVFMFALMVFIIASFWCGCSTHLPELILARTLQGLGGSLMTPVGRLIIARFFERHELAAIMGRVVMVAALGMMLGPVLGGYITYYFSWRWIFWVNIPFGMMTICFAFYVLIDIKPEKVPPFDKIGFILFGSGLAGLTFGFSAISESSFKHSLTFLIIGCSILLLLLYGRYARHQLHPIVNTQVFRFRTFRISALGNLFARTSFGGIPFLLPLLLQIGLGYPAQLSGLLLAPTALGILLIKPFVTRFLQTFGYKKLLMLNTFLISVMLWSFILIGRDISNYMIGTLTLLYGFLMSLQYTGMNSLAYAEILPENLSALTSIMSTIQQISQSFGVALSAFLIYFFSKNNQLTPTVFHYTFLVLGCITLCSIFIFMRLKLTDGDQMIPKDFK